MAEEKMTDDEKTEMLADLTQLVVKRISAVVEDLHKTCKTFPELNSFLSIIIDVSLGDTNLIQVIAGNSKFVKPRLKDLQEKIK